MTLDHLLSELEARGFKIKRSAVHLKLLPKRSSSIEGKRHIKTVPVRICKLQNDFYDRHQDADFCFSIVKDLQLLASLLGPEECIFISPDDKAVVKLGVIAAKHQTSMVMHLEYKNRPPNHDFIVG